MQDRRSNSRHQLIADVKVQPVAGSLWVPGALTNISHSGICIYSSGTIREGEKVTIRMSCLKDGKMQDVEEVHGVVRWTKSVGAYFACGIMFAEEIDRSRFPSIAKCLVYARQNA